MARRAQAEAVEPDRRRLEARIDRRRNLHASSATASKAHRHAARYATQDDRPDAASGTSSTTCSSIGPKPAASPIENRRRRRPPGFGAGPAPRRSRLERRCPSGRTPADARRRPRGRRRAARPQRHQGRRAALLAAAPRLRIVAPRRHRRRQRRRRRRQRARHPRRQRAGRQQHQRRRARLRADAGAGAHRSRPPIRR